MFGRHLRWSTEDRRLLLAGLAGLAMVVAIACSEGSAPGVDEPEDDAGTPTSDASASGRDAATSKDSAVPAATRDSAVGGKDGAVATTDSTVRPEDGELSDASAADDATNISDGATTAPSGDPTSCSSSPAAAENTAAVVAAANTLLNALTTAQQDTISYDKTLTNAKQWSNFPVTFVKRNGVKLAEMGGAAQAAAVALAEVAAGTTGSQLLSELREADEFLVTDGRASTNDYGRGLYYFSVHGVPSTSAAWMLQIAGHHLAYNFMYGGKCTSATPLFDGAEPMTWTDSASKAHDPLAAQRDSMVALVKSIGSASGAKLSGTFSDIVNGPVGGPGGGGSSGDTKYPSSLTYPTGTTGRGVLVSSLTAAQQMLVKTALEAWVKNVADPVSSALLAVYESEASLAATYVGYTGSADLSTRGSYVRIDGPRVWIEATVQGGIIYQNKVHWHTIWRDKSADYGAEYETQ